jgi:hypothetical protein
LLESSHAQLDRYCLSELRSLNEYAVLRRKASEKSAVLADQGMTRVRPEDIALDPIRLVGWYFESRLGREIPDDLDAYVQSLGIDSRDEFYAMLALDRLHAESTKQVVETGDDPG